MGYRYSGSAPGISKNISSSINTYQADILPGAIDILTKTIRPISSGDLSLLGVTDSNNQIDKMIVNYVNVRGAGRNQDDVIEWQSWAE